MQIFFGFLTLFLGSVSIVVALIWGMIARQYDQSFFNLITVGLLALAVIFFYLTKPIRAGSKWPYYVIIGLIITVAILYLYFTY